MFRIFFVRSLLGICMAAILAGGLGGFQQAVYAASLHYPASSSRNSRVQPLFSAQHGGCNSASESDGSTQLAVSACISGSADWSTWKVFPDGYVTWTAASPGLWSSCTIDMYIRDRDQGNALIEHSHWDCTNTARGLNGGTSDVYYAADMISGGFIGIQGCPHDYYNYMVVSAKYNGSPFYLDPAVDELIAC